MACLFRSRSDQRLTQVDQRLHDLVLRLDGLRAGLIVTLLRDHADELRRQIDVGFFDLRGLKHALGSRTWDSKLLFTGDGI